MLCALNIKTRPMELALSPINPKTPSEMYEQYFVPAMFRNWAEILIRRAALKTGDRVLDVACGTGIVARLAAEAVGGDGKVDALDFNPAMLSVAQSTATSPGAKIIWREGSAMALPYPDHSFDAVLCQHGLQFFPDKVEALREMRLVVATTGRVLVIVLQALSKHPVFEALMTSVAHRLSLPIEAVTLPFSMSDEGKLRTMATHAGFRTVDVLAESAVMTFPDAAQFVPLAVMSSAAAVPAFADLQGPEKAALLDAVRTDVEPVVNQYQSGDTVRFTMFAHIMIGTNPSL